MIEDLNQKLSWSKDELSAKAVRLDELEKREAELKSHDESKQKELAELCAKLETLRCESAETQKLLEEKLAKAASELEGLKTDKEGLERRVEELRGDLEAVGSDSSARSAALSGELAEKVKEVAELVGELCEAGGKQKELEARLAGVEVQLEESRKGNSELQARISEMIQNSGDGSIQLTALNEQLVAKVN